MYNVDNKMYQEGWHPISNILPGNGLANWSEISTWEFTYDMTSWFTQLHCFTLLE